MSFGKFAGITATAIKSNMVPLSQPYKLNFSITYNCQSRCLTCNIWKMKPTNELSIDEIRAFAVKNNYFRWVELTGGEPFLRSDIVEIASTFARNFKGLYVLTLPTNSLCNISMVERKIKEILELGIPKVIVTVSLDGYRELHDKIRGVPGNYDKAIAVYKMLMELRKSNKNLGMVFGYTMSNFNAGQFDKTFEEVRREIPTISYNDFHVNLAQESENYYDNRDLNLGFDKAAAQEIQQILNRRQTRFDAITLIENAFLKKLVYYAQTGKSPMRCRSLEASLFMDSYGNVFPSIAWNAKVGNIRETGYDLAPLWNNDNAKQVRQLSKQRMDPVQWTSCEAYQALTGDIKSLL